MPFSAEEVYTTDPPGYIWRPVIHAGPLITIEGRDRYFDGGASMDMRLLSIFPVARSSGSELVQGALLRFLNEIMWFPAAALSWYIDWDPIDDMSSRATIRWAGKSASATFLFDPEGRLVTMNADRYNDQLGRLAPWSTPIDAYGEIEGVRVPVSGTGVWRYEDGDFPYIKLRVTTIETNKPFRQG
jgi:hypothetical protein